MYKEIQALKSPAPQQEAVDMKPVVREVTDRRLRKKNVMLFGLPEAGLDVAANQRASADEVLVQEILA